MTGRRVLERRVRSLEQAALSQGRWFIIECLDGDEDSERINRLRNKIERDHGPLDTLKDEIIINRLFGNVRHVTDNVIIIPLSA